MGYEDAPATQLVATHCACCSRPLVDAASVEAGIGPECRKRHGFRDAQGEPCWVAVLAALATTGDLQAIGLARMSEARTLANVLVHRIAIEQDGTTVLARTNALRALGFTKLADRIAERLATVAIERTETSVIVRAPYSPESVAVLRRVPGRRFEKNETGEKDPRNVFPRSSERALFAALCVAYPGATAIGPKGLFVLGAA